MKKTLFDLQFFADEAAETGSDTENTTEQTTEQPTEPKGNEAKYSDADVDKIVARIIAKERDRADKQVAAEKAKASEAERLGKMTAEEKANERIKALEEKLAESERKEARAAMTKEARAILHAANINVGDELLANLVSEDAESTQASVKSFISLFKAEVEKGIKEAYKGETPKKGGTSSLTAEQIMKVSNRSERQRLINENMHLFK